MRALVYARYFLQNYYEGIDYSSFSSVVFFTDSSLFSTKSFNYRRKELDVVRLTENESLYNELPIHEIILKDRLLRNLDYDEAVDLIKVTFCFWCGLIEDQKPDYLITQAVDNYILHLADLVCLYKSVVFVGLVPAPFDLGTMLTRQSTRVHHAFRKDWTVEDIRTKITTQNEVVGYKNRGVKRKSLLSRLKDQMTFNLKILLFPLLVLMDKERHDAYHWRVTRYSYRSYWRNASSAIYFDNKEVNPDKKTVLIPLNCAPEMAFDYWIDDIRVNDYQNFLLEMVTELNKKFNVIIKEHPHAHYTRVQSFFSSLSEYAKIDVSKKNCLGNYYSV